MSVSNLSRFAAGVAATSFGRSSTIILGFLCLLIYARWLPQQDYGSFVILQVVIGFVTGVSDLGLGPSVTRFLAAAHSEIEKRTLINSVLLVRLLTVGFLAVLALVAKEPLFRLFGSSAPAGFMVFLPILILVEGVASALNAVMAGLFKFAAIGSIEVAVSLCSFIVTVVLVIGLGSGVMGLLYARLASWLLGLALGLLSVSKIHRYRLELDIANVKRMLRFGMPLYISYFLDFLSTRADTVIIGVLLGPAEIAIYEFARKIPDSLSMVYGSFRQVYFPFIANLLGIGDYSQAARILNHSNRLGAWLGCLGALGAFGFGDIVFRALFSEKYLASVPAFGVLMIVLTFMIVDSNLGYSLVASGASDKPPMINALRAIISFAGFFLLIPLLGTVGAALAGLIGMIVANPFNVLFLHRRGVRARVAAYLKPVLILGVCLVVLFVGASYGYLTSIASVALFMIASALLSVITRKDIAMGMREICQMVSRTIPVRGVAK